MTNLSLDRRREFRHGVRDSLAFVLSVLPYGAIVGTLGVNSGATPTEVMLQSTLFFAGASQTVMWELYGLGNPIWVIALAIFAVNFRMVLYSAAIGRKLEPISKPKMISALYILQDISLATGLKRAERPSGLSYEYYMGLGLVLYVIWLVATGLGVVFGQLIENPKSIGLDMLVPIYFLLLVMGFRGKPNMALIFSVSAGVASLVYMWLGSPYHIAAGGVAGMLAAALVAKPERCIA